MSKYRVLLVDDEEADRAERFAGDPEIEIVGADSLQAAQQAAIDGFFHLALVDLQLDAENDKNIDGQYFLRELLDGRPACRRVLFTRHSAKHREALFDLLNPDAPVIHGALNKTDPRKEWPVWIKDQARAWAERTLAIDGLSDLAEAIGDQLRGTEAFGGTAPRVSEPELEYVVSTAFRRVASREGAGGLDISRVSLELLAGGESQSVVLLVRLSTGESPVRVTCVLKVGPCRDSTEECERYEQFVKFRVSPDRRAELLGFCGGDTVGAVVYAFAGQSPEEIRDLDSLIVSRDPEVFPALERLFGAATDDLWRVSAGDPTRAVSNDLSTYFFKQYKLEPTRVGNELITFAHSHGSDYGVVPDENELLASGGKLVLPTEEFYGGPHIRREFTPSVIHGDLNSKNVLISDDGRVRLIDFRYAAVGPVATDFAALETSVRLSDDPGAALNDGLLSLWTAEKRIVQRVWQPRPEDPDDPALDPFWRQVSTALGRLAREVVPALSRDEYLATCLLYALRLSRVRRLGTERRMRLVPWIAALHMSLSR